MNLNDLLQGQISEDLLNQLSQQIGGADKQKTATAATGIATTLMTALAKNAADPKGAQALNNALERDHDGSILDNITSLLGGGQVPSEKARAMNGTGILNHVLGDRQTNAINMISQVSGLDNNKTGSLMTMLAPVIMGMLGQQKKQQGLDVSGIASLLQGTVKQQQGSNQLMDMATRMFDADGDGSMVDDVVEGIGKRFLKSIFGGGRR